MQTALVLGSVGLQKSSGALLSDTHKVLSSAFVPDAFPKGWRKLGRVKVSVSHTLPRYS